MSLELTKKIVKALDDKLARDIEVIKNEIEEQIKNAPDLKALDEVRVNALGKKDFAEKYVMVCLKQSGRLERLIKWLHSNQSYAAKLRLIVIDDEADQASINTRLMENAVDEEPENDVERTRICI